MKKIIIAIIVISIIGISGFAIFNNIAVSIVTLDINPSIKIYLNKDEKVKKVVALNSDAKEIVSGNIKGKLLDDALRVISNNLEDKGYFIDHQVLVLIHSTGELSNGVLEEKIRNNITGEDVFVDVISVDNITKEDETLAKEYNITPAKAAYINQVLETNENIAVEKLVNKSIHDINETKLRGTYCEDGYILEGDFCLKEIGRANANPGTVCPKEYYEYEGKCYKEIPSEENEEYVCREGFSLVGTDCILKREFDAEPSKFSCTSGELKRRDEFDLTGDQVEGVNGYICADYTNATHPLSPCELPANDPTERMSYGGKCYWHRAPIIAEGCPGKIAVNGMCWDDASNILICQGYRDGKQYSSRDDFCEYSIKYTNPVVVEYKCLEGFSLEGKKCIEEEIEKPYHERYCTDGYTLVNNDRCINYNDEISKVNGFICDQDNAKVKGNICVYYEIIEAKHN